MSGGRSHHSSHISSICSSLLSNKSMTSSKFHKEISGHLINIRTLSQCTEALTTSLWLSEAARQLSEACIRELEAQLSASDAHATIRNLKNQELHHQAMEKTGMCKKCKINMEGCVITPLNGAVLFAQQDAECWEKEAAEEVKKKTKTDAVLVREHQH